MNPGATEIRDNGPDDDRDAETPDNLAEVVALLQGVMDGTAPATMMPNVVTRLDTLAST